MASIDLSHLSALGVIELASDASGQTMNLNLAAPAPKEKKPTQRRTASAKSAKPAEPMAEPKKEREEATV